MRRIFVPGKRNDGLLTCWAIFDMPIQQGDFAGCSIPAYAQPPWSISSWVQIIVYCSIMVRAASIQTYYVFMCSLKGKNKYRYVTNYCCWCVVMADAPDRECTPSSGMVITRWVKEDSSQVCDKDECPSCAELYCCPDLTRGRVI